MKKTYQLLIVCDEPTHRERTLRLLAAAEGTTFKIDAADQISEGIQSKRSIPHDAVLLELNQLKRISRDAFSVETGDLPIVVLSGLSDQETDRQMQDHGHLEYQVMCTVTTETLVSSIQNAIRRHCWAQGIINENKLLKKRNRKLAGLYQTAHSYVDNVSHDFRTPLTVINEYCHLLRDGIFGPVPEEQCQMLDVVSDRADDLNNMVDDMLDVSKLEAGKLGVIRKNCRVAEIIKHLRPNLQKKASLKNVDLQIDLDGDLPDVYCDPEKIGRVIVNLAINAIKYCADSGIVRLSATSRLDLHEVRVSVSDNGRGISQENLETIFQRFKQVESDPRNSIKGFGLGLNIAKELVDLNYGQLEVESSVGEGSTFSFTLPIAVPPEVTRRYLDRIKQLNRGNDMISLVHVGIDDNDSLQIANDVDVFLSHFPRRHDLLFRISSHRWLLVHPATIEELNPFFDRVAESLRNTNRNRPHGMLPQLEMRSLGTWKASKKTAEIINQVDSALNIEEFDYV